MPFEKSIIEYITNYIEGHLPKDEWYDEYFSFINDIDLANRLKIEFQNARFIYKLFEGMQAADELLLAEVRTQIIMYVSIYEALIHYILFEYYKDSQEVKDLILIFKKADGSKRKMSLWGNNKKLLMGKFGEDTDDWRAMVINITQFTDDSGKKIKQFSF